MATVTSPAKPSNLPPSSKVPPTLIAIQAILDQFGTLEKFNRQYGEIFYTPKSAFCLHFSWCLLLLLLLLPMEKARHSICGVWAAATRYDKPLWIWRHHHTTALFTFCFHFNHCRIHPWAQESLEDLQWMSMPTVIPTTGSWRERVFVDPY